MNERKLRTQYREIGGAKLRNLKGRCCPDIYYFRIFVKKNTMKKEEVFQYISSDPEIMHGKPCVKGTRIPVWLVVGMLGDGESEKEIIKNYPSLTDQTIKACLKYASFMCEFQTIPV